MTVADWATCASHSGGLRHHVLRVLSGDQGSGIDFEGLGPAETPLAAKLIGTVRQAARRKDCPYRAIRSELARVHRGATASLNSLARPQRPQ